MKNAGYTDDLALLANTPAQAESLLRSQEPITGSIGFPVNADNTEYMCFKQEGAISILNSKPLKLVDQFTYLGSCCGPVKGPEERHELGIT